MIRLQFGREITMSRLETFILLGAAVILAVAVPASAADRYKGFERAEALITVQELKQLSEAKDPKLVILGVVEPLSFAAGHIPGSINIWRPDYELKVGQPYPFEGMILDLTRFQDFARGLGIDNDSRVVVYDEKYDATAIWWAFFLYGKTDVRVVDGGYPAWEGCRLHDGVFSQRRRARACGGFRGPATQRRLAREHGRRPARSSRQRHAGLGRARTHRMVWGGKKRHRATRRPHSLGGVPELARVPDRD